MGEVAGQILMWVFALGSLLPYLAVTTRRLHDTGRSGWVQIWWILPSILVPLVRWRWEMMPFPYILYILLMPVTIIWSFYILAKKGTVGPNQYGSDPIIYTDDKKVPHA